MSEKVREVDTRVGGEWSGWRFISLALVDLWHVYSVHPLIVNNILVECVVFLLSLIDCALDLAHPCQLGLRQDHLLLLPSAPLFCHLHHGPPSTKNLVNW